VILASWIVDAAAVALDVIGLCLLILAAWALAGVRRATNDLAELLRELGGPPAP
jgi:hypothetical protein